MLSSAVALMSFAVLSVAPKPPLYASQHPVPDSSGGGWCSLAASHEHDYGPESSSDFHRHGDHWVFVGDPSSVRGYKGPLFRYQDAHPVPHDVSFAPLNEPFRAHCRRAGMHQHPWEPLPSEPFTFRSGVFRFQRDDADALSDASKPLAAERVEAQKNSAADSSSRRAVAVQQAPTDARVIISAHRFEPAGTHRLWKHKKAKKKSAKHRKHHDDHDEREEDDDEDDDD